ncbi:calcium-binding protein [Rhizobium sp. Leaf453]|uniref:calcium-binding protein n=1 Tax=Rhizobium sp. Leaf453 TaxID=1736380 RepID=UPI00071480E1|nr:hypothetical protein [Rhizobium sp. Leaf453]KQT97360.1 hypothetical protein ASG68_10545 [Rhizobium sp. Leaf453]
MGNEFRVNSYQNNWQEDSNVIALRSGGFLVTWSSCFNEYDDSDVVTTYVAARFYDANGDPTGSELVIRGVNGGHSGTPQATQLANGNIVFTWIEALDDPIFTNDAHIRAQVFTPNGNAVSGVINVDTVASTQAYAPDVVATGDGGFVVSFGASTSTGNFDEVYSRAYNANGTARGADRVLNTRSNDFDELVTKSVALTNGNSIVIWNSEAAIDDGSDNGQNQIRATLFDEHGTALRSDFGLTPHFGGAGGVWSDSENYGYAVASRAGGGFVVANLNWTEADDDDGAMAIYFSAYNEAGTRVTAATSVFDRGTVVGDLDMARLATGHYVVVWNQHSLYPEEIGDDAYAIILSADGTPVSRVFTVGIDADKYDEQVDLSVAALSGGGFAVTYTSDSIDADDRGIAAETYGRGTGAADTMRVDPTGMLSGLAGNDHLIGDTRNNFLSGDSGNDGLSGMEGNDVLRGGSGADRLSGSSGRDTATYDNAARGVTANLSDSSANTNDAKGDVFVSIENLKGSSHDDRLIGDSGANRLDGGSGDDILLGGGGYDNLYGGSGRDVFVFKFGSDVGTTRSATDIIFDFSRADDDIINLRSMDADVTRGGNQAFSFVGSGGYSGEAGELRYVRESSDTYIYGDRNGDGRTDFVIRLDDAISLASSDFIL